MSNYINWERTTDDKTELYQYITELPLKSSEETCVSSIVLPF
jgi:hypothetical protein